jgi:hypothetical protein
MPDLEWEKRRKTPANWAAEFQGGTYWCNRKKDGKYIARWVPEGEYRGEMLGSVSVSTLDAAMRKCWNHAYDQLNSPE